MQDLFRTCFGPAVRAFDSLDDARNASYERDLPDLRRHGNVAGENSVVAASCYLEVIVVRA